MINKESPQPYPAKSDASKNLTESGQTEKERNLPPAIPPARRRIIVKFVDKASLPPGSFSASALEPEISRILDPQMQFKKMPCTPTQAQIDDLTNRAKANDPTYEPPNLLAYRQIIVPEGVQAGLWLRQLRALDITEYAYLHPGPVLPPSPDGPPNPEAFQQTYLQPAPVGIDAAYAHAETGGDGTGQNLTDIEWGWDILHSDLLGNQFDTVLSGLTKFPNHGTMVLGVIAARNNFELLLGIAHEIASIRLIGQYQVNDDNPEDEPDYFTGEAVLCALLKMQPGDVLLLEAQSAQNRPLESEQMVFDMVKFATAAGIVVVAAAGNASLNKDLDIVLGGGPNIFDRNVRDSGAILVASASSDEKYNWSPRQDSCVGKRIDCFAQGWDVVTLQSTSGISKLFGATSAASAIIAGAALTIQGIAQQRYNHRLKPLEIRQLLTADHNTHSANPTADRIGVMPDLQTIIDALPATWAPR